MAALPNPPLPKLTAGYLGKQGKFDEYGLSTVTHEEPVIWLDEDNPQVRSSAGSNTVSSRKKVKM